MRGRLTALGLALLARAAAAGTAYVSDELVLNVYSEENNQGQRLATLHSGASLETLGVSGEFTQVRTIDGTIGWVKSAYLTSHEPATVRLKQLEEELERARATTPALAAAAARSELESLRQQLEVKTREVAALRSTTPAAAPPPADAPAAAGVTPGVATPGVATPGVATPGVVTPGAVARGAVAPWLLLCTGVIALIIGFCTGYAVLAQRLKQKFSGLKVY